ncbi:MAG: UbiA-like polyprenyltransferase [Pirellulales bacterium]
MLGKVRLILQMIRFSHTLFALPFALLAGVMAVSTQSTPAAPFGWRQWTGILLCMVFARSAAMAFNRLVDRELDALNPRTAGRHLPAGLFSERSVGLFAAGCSLGFVVSTLFFWPNRWPLYLAVPVLAFLLGYSYAKRFTLLSHFWLGAALMLAPIATWIALRGELDWPPVILGAAVLMWVAGFDMIYACQDAGFDSAAGLKSVPARWGVGPALRLAAACHLVMIGLLLALPWFVDALGAIYTVGIVAVAALLAYEHWLVRPDDLTRVNVAFFQVNAVVSLGLFVVGSVDLLT